MTKPKLLDQIRKKLKFKIIIKALGKKNNITGHNTTV